MCTEYESSGKIEMHFDQLKEIQLKKNRDIYNFVAVLGIAVACATLLAFFFIYNFGTKKDFTIGNILFDPSAVQQVEQDQKQTKQGKKIHFYFSQLEFSLLNSLNHQISRRPISLKNYYDLFHLIKTDKNLNDPKDLDSVFIKSSPATLFVSLSSQVANEPVTVVSQEIQFIPEDYYRVELIDQTKKGEWIYFYHPHIYQQFLQLMVH